MAQSTSTSQPFVVERHGDIAVITPSPEVEKMPENLMEQAAQMVLAPLRNDPPAGLIFDLSKVDYVGSVFLSFLLRCHKRVKEHGSEVVVAGASAKRARVAAHDRPRHPLGAVRHPHRSHGGPDRRLTLPASSLANGTSTSGLPSLLVRWHPDQAGTPTHDRRPGDGDSAARSFQHVHDDATPRNASRSASSSSSQQIRETADKLVRDGATRGDVKLLSTALKELRYCFKVFTPYSQRAAR